MGRAKAVIAGTGLYAGFACATYFYFKKNKDVASTLEATGAADCSCAFDRLAGEYDRVVGSEETYMGYGLFRWWLLRGIKVGCGGW